MGLPMPIPIAAILNTLGPIAVDGRILYPTPFTTNDVRGTWIKWSTVGLVSSGLELFGSIVGGVDVVGNIVGNFNFNAATYPTTATFPMTPITATAGFMNIWANMFNGVASANEFQAPMIKLDSHNPVGKSNQLVIADMVMNGAGTINANNPSVTATPLRVVEVYISQIGSYKSIVGDELGCAIICPVGRAVDLTGAASTVAALNPPFRAPVGGGQRASGLAAFALNCMSAEVSNAVGTALANMKRETMAINGNTIDVSKNGDLFGMILDKVVAPIFGDGVAAGIKSSPIAPILRHMTPLILPGVGAFGKAAYVADRLGVFDGVVSTFSTGSKTGKASDTAKGKGVEDMTDRMAKIMRQVVPAQSQRGY